MIPGKALKTGQSNQYNRVGISVVNVKTVDNLEKEAIDNRVDQLIQFFLTKLIHALLYPLLVLVHNTALNRTGNRNSRNEN
jgi:hypothetical protein